MIFRQLFSAADCDGEIRTMTNENGEVLSMRAVFTLWCFPLSSPSLEVKKPRVIQLIFLVNNTENQVRITNIAPFSV
jgi:hypothetical protein